MSERPSIVLANSLPNIEIRQGIEECPQKRPAGLFKDVYVSTKNEYIPSSNRKFAQIQLPNIPESGNFRR